MKISKLAGPSKGSPSLPSQIEHFRQQDPDDELDSIDNNSTSSNQKTLLVSDIIGNFGLFQLIVLLFSTIREGCTAYDSVVTSVILKPVKGYICIDYDDDHHHHNNNNNNNNNYINQITTINNNMTAQKQLDQCYKTLNNSSFLLDTQNQMVKCNNWLFTDPNELGDKSAYLTINWNLICHREWLLAMIETIFFVGIVFGGLIWGFVGDTYGRKVAYCSSHVLALLAGICSVFITSYWPFVICRFLHGLGASGYFIIYSMYSEVIGANLRASLSVISHFGWGFFIIMVPIINKHVPDYRYMLAISPIVATITLPIALWFPESSRLMMAKGEFEKGRQILKRIVKINRIKTPEIEINGKLDLIEKQVKLETEQVAEQRRGKNLYAIIFTNRTLCKDTIIMCYLSFLGQMLYFVLTLNFYYIDNMSVEDNFLKSGLGEWVGIIFLFLMLKVSTRRTGFRIHLVLLILVFSLQYLIDIKVLSSLNTRWFIAVNNGLGNLCTANVLFLTLTVILEVYPTVVRDTGKGIVCSFLEMGSTTAPILIQFGKLIGNDKINLLVMILSTLGLISSEFLTVNEQTELSNT